MLKTLVGLAAVYALGVAPARRLLMTTSTEAVVNARLVTLRAPIEGEIAQARALEFGAPFGEGDVVLTISNARLDRSALYQLRRALVVADAMLVTLSEKQTALGARAQALARQQEAFRVGRIAQLGARMAELDAQIVAALARRAETAAAQARALALSATGVLAKAALEKFEREAIVAREAVLEYSARKEAIDIERRAAEQGVYIGDSYNDTPQSAQRAHEVAIELADLAARLAGARAERQATQAALAEEEARLADQSHAQVRASATGRVWDMLAAPGERVVRGQDLLRLIDCGAATITASLSENAYQRLRIGQRATFRPRDGGAELEGHVIALNGPASIGANSAISQATLAREPYHVSVKAPALAHSGECGLGRTGVLVFEAAPSSSLTSSLQSLTP